MLGAQDWGLVDLIEQGIYLVHVLMSTHRLAYAEQNIAWEHGIALVCHTTWGHTANAHAHKISVLDNRKAKRARGAAELHSAAA